MGTGGADAKDWMHQTTASTCDMVSQGMIPHEFDVNVREDRLVYKAASGGRRTKAGTPAQDGKGAYNG